MSEEICADVKAIITWRSSRPGVPRKVEGSAVRLESAGSGDVKVHTICVGRTPNSRKNCCRWHARNSCRSRTYRASPSVVHDFPCFLVSRQVEVSPHKHGLAFQRRFPCQLLNRFLLRGDSAERAARGQSPSSPDCSGCS